jgi:hypothetical protein
MHINHGIASIAAVVPLVLLSGVARGDGVPVNIINDGTEAVLVTVYDISLGRRTLILSQRVNGFATIAVNPTADANGRANIAWSAVTVDPDNRRCGQAVREGLGDASAVNVHADADCSTAQPAPRQASFED